MAPATGFQQQVNLQPAPALPGDFASANPRESVLAGPGQLVAGPSGLTPGRFAWMDATGTYASNSGSGPVTGFVHRAFGEATMLSWYTETGNTILPGQNVTLHMTGDFWVTNAGSNPVTIGMKAYASFVDGSVTFGPSGSPPTAGTVTASIAPQTSSSTGSINGTLLSVTAVSSGNLVPGTILSGSGVTTGTSIVAQTSGTQGGAGTYTVSIPQVAASTTLSGSYGLMTVTASLTGSVNPGNPLSGTNVAAGTSIVQAGTAANTYIVTPSQTTASTTITAGGAVETRWYSGSIGQPGELIKISAHPMG